GPIRRSPSRWTFDVDHGGAVPGVSGSPVCANGQMIGVLSNNNGHKVATQLDCSTPEQLVKFMRETDAKGCAAWKLGEWSEPAKNFADAPSAPHAISNRPIDLRAAPSGQPAEHLANAPAGEIRPVPILPRVTQDAPQIPPPP